MIVRILCRRGASWPGGRLARSLNAPSGIRRRLAATVGGIFIVSALVGVLTTGLDAKLTDLRKGRSRVIESGHTVVLGWSEQIFTLIAELSRAGDHTCVVVLADRD